MSWEIVTYVSISRKKKGILTELFGKIAGTPAQYENSIGEMTGNRRKDMPKKPEILVKNAINGKNLFVNMQFQQNKKRVFV